MSLSCLPARLLDPSQLRRCPWHLLARRGVPQRGTKENRLWGRGGLRPCGTPSPPPPRGAPFQILRWSPSWPPDFIIRKWSSGMSVSLRAMRCDRRWLKIFWKGGRGKCHKRTTIQNQGHIKDKDVKKYIWEHSFWGRDDTTVRVLWLSSTCSDKSLHGI